MIAEQATPPGLWPCSLAVSSPKLRDEFDDDGVVVLVSWLTPTIALLVDWRLHKPGDGNSQELGKRGCQPVCFCKRIVPLGREIVSTEHPGLLTSEKVGPGERSATSYVKNIITPLDGPSFRCWSRAVAFAKSGRLEGLEGKRIMLVPEN